MQVLIDYDNVEPIDRSRGLTYLALRVLSAIGVSNLQSVGRADLRLYGGWYKGRSLSRRAQTLGAEIERDFPTVQTIGERGVNLKLPVGAQLATSLMIDPKKEIFNTYRQNAPPVNLETKHAPWTGCSEPTACAIGAFTAFFAQRECPHPSCSVTPAEIFYRSEQKLVDTMLTADMINVASKRGETFAVVSSDDDMWPGIKSALLLGCRVFHVHPKPGRYTPSCYSDGVGSSYLQSTF